MSTILGFVACRVSRAFSLGFVFASASLVLGACSSTTTGAGGTNEARQPIDADAFCAKAVDECKDPSLTAASCAETFALIRVTDDCNAALTSATCADLSSKTSAFTTACFPACSSTATSCNGDGTITTCSDGRSIVVDCAAGCTASGKEYSGTCASSYQSQRSGNGQDKCWCR